MEKVGLFAKVRELLKDIDIEDTAKLEQITKQIREMISGAEMPDEMEKAIWEAYDMLDIDKKMFDEAKGTALDILIRGREPPFVAVRSSSTAEDLAEGSFAGQMETFLNVKGKTMLTQKIKNCFASLFTARATYYREKKGFGQEKAKIAVVVQKMINSDKSGVMFSRDPVGNPENIMIEAVWGLGEGIVSGTIKPDNYITNRDMNDFKILEVKISEKKIAFTRASSGETQIVKLTEKRSKQQVLTNDEIKALAEYAIKLEEHYGKPQDIEFSIADGIIYIVQSRPITTLGKEKKISDIKGEVLVSGLAASPGVGVGIVRIVMDLKDLNKVKKGDILVTPMTNPDMVVTMQKAAGIVTDEGGITSHAAIVSREMGIPAVVGTGDATKKLKDGEIVTVDGNFGKVYAGRGEAKAVEIKPIVPTRTKIKVLVDLPEFAPRAALSGAKEIGLVRLEGIIASSGRHPLGFLKKNALDDYSKLIYEGLKKILEPFEGMWVRTSDIRSDEYTNLEGAPKEIEGNPMLGNHGIRFGLKNPGILKAEIDAIIKIAEENPEKKVGVMMPQVISVNELKELKKIVNEIGKPANFQIGIMVETPAAVEIINELCEEGMDFISFGTNDLTQYILAIDRNNSDVQYLYDEMNPAVLAALSYVIRRCKKYKVLTSICGQAGSREEMVKFLVENGIDSISVNADAAERISKFVAELESKMPRPDDKEKPKFIGKLPEKPIEPIFEQKPQSEKKAEEKQKEPMQEIPEIPVPSPSEQIEGNVDIQDVILEELEKISEKDYENGDYVPGLKEEEKEIPPLNEAIPVEKVIGNSKNTD